MDAQQFARGVAAAVASAGVKRTVLAEVAGIAESSIRAVEAGHCPSVVRADALLRALGRSLVLGDPEAPPLELPQARKRRGK